jgi:hypothetical protein
MPSRGKIRYLSKILIRLSVPEPKGITLDLRIRKVSLAGIDFKTLKHGVHSIIKTFFCECVHGSKAAEGTSLSIDRKLKERNVEL